MTRNLRPDRPPSRDQLSYEQADKTRMIRDQVVPITDRNSKSSKWLLRVSGLPGIKVYVELRVAAEKLRSKMV